MLIRVEKPAGRLINRALKDYAGVRFGRLVALSLVERDQTKENNHQWRFRCDCGTEKTIRIKLVRAGKTSSCGCLFSEMMATRNTTHGLSGANRSEYRSWKDMRSRCFNPNNSDFKDYGGRGITVCERWNDFSLFLEDMGEKPAGHTIDRIRVNEGYSPDNCRWATTTVQANNKRSNHVVTMNGETKTLQQWSDLFGLDSSKVRYRLAQGWPLDRVFGSGDGRRRSAD